MLIDSNKISQHFKGSFRNCVELYTDGSKSNNRVSSASICCGSISSQRLPDVASIFTAELAAVKLALAMIQNQNPGRFLVLSDSLSSLLAIVNLRIYFPLLCEILEECHKLYNTQKVVTFVWVPSHIGILGNEEADKAAKAALNQSIAAMKIPFSDLKQNVTQHLKLKWQEHWSNQAFNKLLPIKPILGPNKYGNITNRRERALLSRLRIGHTYLTHSWLLRRENNPVCVDCQSLLTVEHILISCPRHQMSRSKFFTNSSLHEILNFHLSNHVIPFLKEIGLFDRM